jgi:hypothetical protein
MRRLRSGGTELLPYENARSLERLQEAYGAVGEMLRRRRKVTVLELDAAEVDADQLAERVENTCLELQQPGRRSAG